MNIYALPFSFQSVFVLFIAMTFPVHATSWSLRGVDSSIIVEDGLVVFRQRHSGVTVLDLGSGKVLARKTKEDENPHPGAFIPYAERIYTHPDFWSLFYHSDVPRPELPNVPARIYPTNGWVAESLDGNGGNVTYAEAAEHMPWWGVVYGGCSSRIVGSKLILHKRIYDTSHGQTTSQILIIDAQNGTILLDKPAPGPCFWVCSNETEIYLLRGDYMWRPEGVVVWNYKGEILRQFSGPPPLDVYDYNEPSCLKVGELFFFRDGRVEKESEDGAGLPPIYEGGSLFRAGHAPETNIELKLSRGILRRTAARDMVCLHYRSKDSEWFGCLPYLQDRESIVAISEGDGKLLLGSVAGHVECIDLATGKSLWIYAFPVLRWHYLRHSSPAWYGDSAWAWHRNKWNLRKTIGMVRLPEDPGEDQMILWKNFRDTFTGKLILDPMPEDRYADYAWHWLMAWIPIFCLHAAMILGPRRGPKIIRVPLFIVAWIVSLLGALIIVLCLGVGFHLLDEGGFSGLHSLAWLVGTIMFPAMLWWWRISVWERQSTSSTTR